MKTHRTVTARQAALHERSLYQAILTLRTPEECRAFFRDLCTPAEIEAMADRWAVVESLGRGLPYREVYRATGVSVTTVGRVARYLAAGNGGYQLAASRIESQRQGSKS
jgi:TrpR-related protein YerC/YecD